MKRILKYVGWGLFWIGLFFLLTWAESSTVKSDLEFHDKMITDGCAIARVMSNGYVKEYKCGETIIIPPWETRR